MPLGLSAEFGRLEYGVTTVELDPGETLLLCTDGLVEQPGADLDDGIRLLTTLVRNGPADLGAGRPALRDRRRAGRRRRHGAAVAAPPTGRDPQAGGRLQQHVAPGDPEALVAARHMIGAAVRAWGARGRSDEIELVADELIVNALMHTDGPAIVTLRILAGSQRRLRVEVEDRSSALPRRREAGDSGVSGRGLMLVDRLADVWGVEPRGSGKCVWCEFVMG